jgi:hypothetical protein
MPFGLKNDALRAQERYFIHHSVRRVLLPDDALRAQERRCHFPTMHVMCL